MSGYRGLDDKLRCAVLERDRGRCRGCGATNRPVHLHHITYRRGKVDDHVDNLISLCWECHQLVHTGRVNGRRFDLAKADAQELLRELVATPGMTLLQLQRRKRSAPTRVRDLPTPTWVRGDEEFPLGPPNPPPPPPEPAPTAELYERF